MHRSMSEQEMKKPWVSIAMTDKRVSSQEVVSAVKDKKFGTNAVLAASDMESNRKAMEEGYTLVDPRQTSATEQEKLRNKGGLKTAEAMFGHKPLAGPGITPDHEQTKFSQWVQDLASYIGLEATVRFVESPEGKAIAECTANSRCPQVTFNVSLLPKG
jgi:hypothetical protein